MSEEIKLIFDTKNMSDDKIKAIKTAFEVLKIVDVSMKSEESTGREEYIKFTFDINNNGFIEMKGNK